MFRLPPPQLAQFPHGRETARNTIGWLLLFLAFLGTSPSRADAAAKKLNVLLFVGDDLNCELACYGHPLVQSPNIDKLAARGVRFERAYCQYPLCAPSRASFISGRRPGSKMNDVVYLSDHFAKHGYFTVEVGKVRHSFGPSASSTWEAKLKGGQARQAVELIEKNKDRPFFLAIGVTNTHAGGESINGKYRPLYPLDKMTWPKEPAGGFKDIPAAAFQSINVIADHTEEYRRKRIANYYTGVSTLDGEVAAAIEALDRLKLWNDTIIICTSDHGFQLGEHGGVYDKRTVFESAVRVPLIVVAPGKRANVVSPGLVELVDLYPTLAELCGLPAPANVEGTSFAPLLNEPQRAWKKAAFSVANPGVKDMGRTVRTERYRYAEWGDAGPAVLYDYQSDPHELRNLAVDPQHKGTVDQMRRLLQAGWQAALPVAPSGAGPPK